MSCFLVRGCFMNTLKWVRLALQPLARAYPEILCTIGVCVGGKLGLQIS